MGWASSLHVTGDLIISISFSLLFARILTRGNASISLTSQTLHFIVIALRWSGSLLVQPSNESQIPILACLEVYMMIAAASTLVALRWTGGQTVSREQRLVTTLKESSIYLIPSLLLAYRINYASFSWSESWPSNVDFISLVSKYFSVDDLLNLNAQDGFEIAWAVSMFLAAVADIPQYAAYYRHTSQTIDRLLMTIMAMVSVSGVFYATSYIASFHEGHSFNYIGFSSATLQAFGFWMLFVLVTTKVNDYGSNLLDDLEAQMEEYDAERWGGEAIIPYTEESREDKK